MVLWVAPNKANARSKLNLGLVLNLPVCATKTQYTPPPNSTPTPPKKDLSLPSTTPLITFTTSYKSCISSLIKILLIITTDLHFLGLHEFSWTHNSSRWAICRGRRHSKSDGFADHFWVSDTFQRNLLSYTRIRVVNTVLVILVRDFSTLFKCTSIFLTVFLCCIGKELKHKWHNRKNKDLDIYLLLATLSTEPKGN